MNVSPAVDVQISLVNTNSRELVLQCLASLAAACEGISWRTLLVDNASTDGSAEIVRSEFPDIEVIQNAERMGFSANHNQVIRRAIATGARFVLVLNEDTVLDAGAIRELVKFSDADPRVGAAGPTIIGRDGEVQRSLLSYPTVGSEVAASFRPGKPRDETRSGGWLNGSCVLVRTDALREIGLLDERFFIFFEDTDLGLRLRESGWKSAVCPSARIVHYGHQVVSQPTYGDRMERQMVRSRYLYFEKHQGRVRAEICQALSRCAFCIRATKAATVGICVKDNDERKLATLLWRLAMYDPRESLAHELAPVSTVVAPN